MLNANAARRDLRRLLNTNDPDLADRLYRKWADEQIIYFCPECDERSGKDYEQCPRFPREHNESGYMGTGNDVATDIQRLAARLVA